MGKPLILAALLGLVACADNEPPGDRGIPDRIAAEVSRGTGAVVDLAVLAPFEWTRFCAFGPYTTQEAAEDELGFRWPYTWGNIEHLDDRSYLVFVNGDSVVAAFDYPRGRGDFHWLDSACYERATARFVIVEQGLMTDGAPHLVLRPEP